MIINAFASDVSLHLLFCLLRGIASSEVKDLFNIVHQAVKHPLNVDLDMTAQGKPVHFLAAANVPKYRLYNTQPFAVNAPSLFRVDLLLHLIGNAARAFTIKHMNLP